MSYPLSDAELDEQRVELLPARTVLSMFAQADGGGVGANGTDSTGLFGLGLPIVGDYLNPANAKGGDGQPGAVI